MWIPVDSCLGPFHLPPSLLLGAQICTRLPIHSRGVAAACLRLWCRRCPFLLPPPVPKAQSEKCVPDRDPCWEVLDVTKKAVASPRIISLAKPKERRDTNEGYNPYYISPASLMARASPRLQELATPKTITKKV